MIFLSAVSSIMLSLLASAMPRVLRIVIDRRSHAPLGKTAGITSHSGRIHIIDHI